MKPVAWTTKLQLEWLNNLKNNSAIMWNWNDRNKMGLNEESVLIPLYTRSDVGDYYEGWEEGYQACKKDTAPRELSDEEILEYSEVFALDYSPLYEFTAQGLILFVRAILDETSEK